MRVVVLQTGQFEHALSATRVLLAYDPCDQPVGFVRESDLDRAHRSGCFAQIHPLPSDPARLVELIRSNGPFDLCLLPFEDRLGVRYWNVCRVAISLGIPIIVSYNRLSWLKRRGRVAWLINTLLITVAFRTVHTPALWAWRYLRRWLDVAAVFGLAVFALMLAGWRAVLRALAGAPRSEALPSGRRRVILFIPSLGLGGAQRQLVSLLKHLDRVWWDPEVVTLDLPDKFFEPAVRELGVPVTYLNRNYDYWMLGVAWRLMRHLRTAPCHVLHGWMHYAAMLGAVAGTMAGVPTIIGSYRSERPGRFPWHYPKWQRGIDVLTSPLNTRLIANSKAVRVDNKQWALIPERKIVTIYNGVEVNQGTPLDPALQHRLKLELGLPLEAPLVGTVGRLDPEKDHVTFLRAARRISHSMPETCFLIVGEGPTRPAIEGEIKKLELGERVKVIGKRRDVHALLQLLDVFILTSRSEGFPNVLLEAAVAGVPIVTTATGGAVEAIVNGETGYVVSCGDPEAVANRVLELLGDVSLRKRFVESAKKRTKSYFSAGKAAAEIEAVYVTSLNDKRNDKGEMVGAEQPLRVCFISFQAYGVLRPQSGLPFGGAEVQMTALAKELARDPHFEVVVLTGDGSRTERELEGNVTIVLHPLCAVRPIRETFTSTGQALATPEKQQTFWDRVVEQGYRCLNRCPTPLASAMRSVVRGVYACRRWLLSLSFLRWLVQNIREFRTVVRWVRLFHSIGADIYVMRCASAQVGYIRIACLLLRRTFVYMVAHEIDVSGEYARANPNEGRLFEKGMQKADAIVCQNGKQLDLLRHRYRREGYLMPSLSPFASNNGSGKQPRRTILWVARVDEWKQPELFVQLAREIPDSLFVMVAPPSQVNPDKLPNLRAQVVGLPNLRLLEGASLDQTTSLFQEALVFVNSSRAEGFPNTFLQAATCGTPIVSWAVNPDGILNQYQMGYCAEQDWSCFVHCVRLLCSDATLHAQLAENGRRYVREHHDPATVARQYKELFKSLRDRRTGQHRRERARSWPNEKQSGGD